jgi:hypothetical protein
MENEKDVDFFSPFNDTSQHPSKGSPITPTLVNDCSLYQIKPLYATILRDAEEEMDAKK